MARRGGFNKPGAMAVDEGLGNAFPIVERVEEHLDKLAVLAGITDKLTAIYDNLDLLIGGGEGPAGTGIADIEIDHLTGHLRVTLTTGVVIDAGRVIGEKGEDGVGLKGDRGVSVTGVVINQAGHAVFTFSDGTTIDAGKITASDGRDGVGIVNAEVDQFGILVLTMSDGSVIGAGYVRSRDGEDGKDGTNGTIGISVTNAVTNQNGELVLSFSDGTNRNVGEIVGTNGTNGAAGRGIVSSEVTQDGKLKIVYSDGTSATLGTVQGVGIQSVNVAGGVLKITLTNGVVQDLGRVTGRGIQNTVVDNDGRLVITYDDQVTYTSGSIIGPRGLKGDDALSLYSTVTAAIVPARSDGTMKDAYPIDSGVLRLYRGTTSLSLAAYTVNIAAPANLTVVYDTADLQNPRLKVTAFTGDSALFTVYVYDGQGVMVANRTFGVIRIRDGAGAYELRTTRPILAVPSSSLGVPKTLPVDAGVLSIAQGGAPLDISTAQVFLETTDCTVVYTAATRSLSLTALTADLATFTVSVQLTNGTSFNRTVVVMKVKDGKDGSNRTPGDVFEATRKQAAAFPAGYALETDGKVYFQSAWPNVFAAVGNAGSAASDSFRLQEQFPTGSWGSYNQRTPTRGDMIYFKGFYYAVGTSAQTSYRWAVMRSSTAIQGSFVLSYSVAGSSTTFPNTYPGACVSTDGNNLVIVVPVCGKLMITTTTSTDPTTWAAPTDRTAQLGIVGATVNIYGSKYRNGVYVAFGYNNVANDAPLIAYSVDPATTWARSVLGQSTNQVFDMEWDPRTGLWYACGSAGFIATAPAIANGSPGAWTVRPAVAPQDLHAIAVTDTGVVFLGANGRMVTTADGTVYTATVFIPSVATVDSLRKAGNSWVILCTSTAIDGRSRILVTNDFVKYDWRYYDDGSASGTVQNLNLLNNRLFFFETVTGLAGSSTNRPTLVVSQTLDVDPNLQFVMPTFMTNNPAFGRYIKA